MELISKSEFAKRMGVSRQYIGRICKEGKLPISDGNKLDYEACAIIFQTGREQSDRNNQLFNEQQKGKGAAKAAEILAQGKSAEQTKKDTISWGSQYQKARTAVQAIKARREEIELKQIEKSLISVSSIKQQIETISNIVRTRLNKFPTKYAGRLVGLTTIEIQETLETGIYEILSEFQDMLTAAKEETADKK